MKKYISAIALTATLLTSNIGFAKVEAAQNNLLYVGSWDSEVSTVQQILQTKGYFEHEVTGYYGRITESAVKDFQKDSNIKVDGIVGTETRTKLYADGNYTDTDIYWLSRIVYAEAQGEGYNGMLAVANCIINRAMSGDFPNTVKGVIFDTKYGVQYQPVSNGTIYNIPNDTAIQAAKDALNGKNNVGGSLYFFNPRTATNSWIANNRQYFATIGNHAFYI